MSNYPKIYSISTVGIRQHDNADYMLHSVRTDFTGNNGLGKSLIADLLQLIFVPLRDEWKPGTEGLDEKERKIDTIPLEREWISHAYCFLNIEKSKGKFLTIGVLIPRTSRVPIRPFIIQKGDDFENKKIQLKPFEQVLKSSDFIAENLHIYELAELKRTLKKKYDIYLKDFYQRDQVNEYFDLLFKNQILPIDLTKETNLKSFAKVLQSFSKAKTLKITDSKSLQNFLFEDDEDIKTTFDNQKETLNQHIRNFHRADQEIKTWEEKQKRLLHLKDTNEIYLKSKENYLSLNAHLHSNKSIEASSEYIKNESIKNKAFEEYTNAKATFVIQCGESYALMLAQKEICNEIRVRLEEEAIDAGKQNLKILKDILDLYDGSNPDSLFNWAIKEGKALSIEQETVIMCFKEIFAKRIKKVEGKKFTISPKTLLNSFEVEGDGIWINLGEVSEYFPFVNKRMFDDKNNLHKAIEKDKKQITDEISQLTSEANEINQLNESLLKIGCNQDLVEIYQNKERVENYEINRLLSEENVQFATDNFNSFAILEKLKADTKLLDDKITDIIGKTKLIESELEQNKEILEELFIDIAKLKIEIINPVDTTDANLKFLSKEELLYNRKENKKAIKVAEGIRSSTKAKRTDQLSIYNTAKGQSNSLKESSESASRNFLDSKRNLEEQTELKFEKLLSMGEVTDEIIELSKNEYDNAHSLYYSEYITVASSFEESKPEKRNPELYDTNGLPYYSYQTIENVLCGKIGLSGLTTELRELNRTLITLGDLQLKILTEVFSLVEKQYKAHDDTVRRLNFFFEKNKVSDAFQFKVEFEPRKDINIAVSYTHLRAHETDSYL